MLCDICGKKPAVIHYTQVINNEKSEVHLCESCAKKQGVSIEKNFSFSDFLGGFSPFEAQLTRKQDSALQCPVCGMTGAEFQKTGRLGCEHCYEVFRPFLQNILKRVHGSNVHMGKVPFKTHEVSADSQSLLQLKKDLHEAIEKEEYEKAAEIRDRIRILKEKG